jgi:cell division protein FtsA
MARAARVESAADLVVVDFGASRILAAALEGQPSGWRVRAWEERPSHCMQRGVIVDDRAAAAVVREVLAAIASITGNRTPRVVTGVGAGAVRSVHARGSIRLRLPAAIQRSHLHRALDAAADIGLPSDHEILHVLPVAYEIDGARVVRHPLGARARHVVAEAALVTVRSATLDALQRAIECTGATVVGAAAAPLAAARVALGPEDRRRGAAMLDLGAEGCGAAVYRHGALQALAAVPIGGAHVTRDITYALQVDFEQAELLKRRLGVALIEAASPERGLEVARGSRCFQVAQPMLAEIIEARLEEMLVLMRDGLRSQSAHPMADRVVLCGGGARLRGVAELVEQVFGVPARVAQPESSWGAAAGDPACCTALGLIEYAARSGLLRREPEAAWARGWERVRRSLAAPRWAGRSAVAAATRAQG